MKQLTGPEVLEELTVIGELRRSHPPRPGTARPVIRPLARDDEAALEEMALRCSLETLRRRFHGPVPGRSTRRVADVLLAGRAEDHLVAEADGAIVGIASLHRHRFRSGEGEIAVLVEDEWQGTGVGHRLTGHLLRRARERGLAVVVAEVMREPAFVLDRLSHAVARTSVEYDGPVATVRIPVAAPCDRAVAT